MNFVDLTGQKFNRLTVISRDTNTKYGEATWKCYCDCEIEVSVRSYALKSGSTKSCGCYLRDVQKRTDNKYLKHGVFHKDSRLYSIWNAMMSRCYNKNNKRFKDYGLVGITVTEKWHDPSKFYIWAVNNGYSCNLTIDRINNFNGYSPDNCRWVDMKTQQNNRKNNKRFVVNGMSRTQREWEEFMGLSRGVIYNRLKLGWSLAQAIFGRNYKDI